MNQSPIQHQPTPSSHEPPEVFRTQILVRFRDCDPAGIVFYPRYLEMFNNLVEDFFRDRLDLSFEDLIARGWGIPTVHLNVDFFQSSRLGETLDASLAVTGLGQSSIYLEVVMRGPGDVNRVRGKVVLVLTELGLNRAQLNPDELRAKLGRYVGPMLKDKIDANSSTSPMDTA